MSGKFIIKTYYKSELAALYEVPLKELRTWLKSSRIWHKLGYGRAHKLTPAQVKMIVEHLGAPGDYE